MRKKIISAKDVANKCGNCAFGSALADGKVLCKKSGIRNPDSQCKKFKYDPLCRVPRRKPRMAEYSEEDFAL